MFIEQPHSAKAVFKNVVTNYNNIFNNIGEVPISVLLFFEEKIEPQWRYLTAFQKCAMLFILDPKRVN